MEPQTESVGLPPSGLLETESVGLPPSGLLETAVSPAAPRLPAYGSASLADLGRALLHAVGVHRGDDPLRLPAADRVIVLVLDGVGAAQLHAHRDAAAFLAAHSERALTSVFPSTTATALTSLATAEPPGRHGLLGYTVGLPRSDRPLNLLTWQWGPPTEAEDARAEVIPERFQPLPTIFETATAADIDATVVSLGEFVASGLTRAALRGGSFVGADGPDITLRHALDAAGRSSRALVYAHHGAVDTVGHLHGPGSDAWLSALRATDHAVERAAGSLPERTLLVVTADHGMLAIDETDWIELDDEPDLEAGVRVIAGEARVRQLHVVPGAQADVLTAWREQLSDRFAVVTREDAVAAGWFGPEPRPEAVLRIGDVIAVAHGDAALVHRRWDPFGGRLPGMHGALTPEEVDVPLATFTSAE
ncbi:MAG: alkaline phosphatase family protein [Actinobacteria bacterium]|nr:alkaline phosphatase family protein [Actinomycetota bacterium]